MRISDWSSDVCSSDLGVGPDRTAGVGGIDQAGQFAAIVPGGIAGRPGADEAVAPVDADMRFVAEHGRGDLGHELTIGSLLAATALARPAHIAVLLGQPCRLGGPCLGDAAVLADSAPLIRQAPRVGGSAAGCTSRPHTPGG